MKIGIIGAGNVGGALARASKKAGHTVAISAAEAEHATKVAAETGATAAKSNAEAVAGSDIVILAVPFDSVSGIVTELGAQLEGKVVVDVTNRFTGDQLGAPSNAERIQEMAKGAHVVKAFNTIFASRMVEPKTEGVALDGYVVGDDPTAKQKALSFVASLGFRAIDAGPLAMARALEGMGTLNIALNLSNGWPWQSGWKLVGPTG